MKSQRGWLRSVCWVSLVFATSACSNASCSVGKKAEVEVDCRRASEGYDCALRHVSGTGRANTCFSIRVTCDNGASPRGSACHTVAPGTTEHVTVPLASFKNMAQCQNATAMKIEDLKITVE